MTELSESNNSRKWSPYIIGPGIEGYAEQTQFLFYDFYRRKFENDREAFIERCLKEEDKHHLLENISIQIELMIYLKFWESEEIVKKLFELSRLAQGFEYDWHFNIESFEKGRQEIIREYIRDPLKDIVPKFYELVKDIYNNQIRNAIAHSQFAFIGRNIKLTNKHLSTYYKLHELTFEEWEEIIHQVILLYNEILVQKKKYDEIYIEKSLPMQNGLPVRITYPNKESKISFYKYDTGSKRWAWNSNLKR